MEQDVNWLYVGLDLALTCVMLVLLLILGWLGSSMFEQHRNAVNWVRENEMRQLWPDGLGTGLKFERPIFLLRAEAILAAVLLVGLSVGGARLATVILVWFIAVALHFVIVVSHSRERIVGITAEGVKQTLKELAPIIASLHPEDLKNPASTNPISHKE